MTEDQENQILEYATLPVPLSEVDLETPFLYVRGYGVFYPNFGHHHILLATIYGFKMGLESAGDGLIEIGLSIDEMQELMLEEEGIAWLSGVGNNGIECTKLNFAEKTYLPGATEI